MLHNSLFISGEEYFSIKNSPSINIAGSNISTEFLKQILSNDKYYNYIEKYFNDEIDKIVLKYNDSYLYLKYTKSQIIKAIQTLRITNEIVLSDKLNRYRFLKQKILFSNFSILLIYKLINHGYLCLFMKRGKMVISVKQYFYTIVLIM